MATPVIKVDSNSGSDTAASGAGPATALTGSAGVSVGTTITLDGSPDLSGVATDGTHVIFFNDTGAGNRNFDNITAVDNGLKTVTVTTGFTAGTKAWAIGGKRASIGGTLSLKLFSNNSAAGDAMPGWVVEMQSAHAETLSATVTMRRAGDNATGEIVLRGAAAAATMPALTFSNNGSAISMNNQNFLRLEGFSLLNSNGTKTASVGIASVGTNCVIRNVKIATQASNFWKGITNLGNAGLFEHCEIAYAKDVGAAVSTGSSLFIRNCSIHDNNSNGTANQGGINISVGSANVATIIDNCVIYGNTGDGIHITATTTTTNAALTITQCTIHGNTGDAIEFDGSNVQPSGYSRASIHNNNLTGNTGYALNFSGASMTAALVDANQVQFYNNNTGTGATANTAGICNLTLVNASVGNVAVAPGYVNAATGDFRCTGATDGLGYPSVPIGLLAPNQGTCTSIFGIGMQGRRQAGLVGTGAVT